MSAPSARLFPANTLLRLGGPLLGLSLLGNFSALVAPLFMMQVLDRVLPSGNMHTLVMLLLVVLGVLIFGAVVEYFRDLSLSRCSHWVDGVLTRAGLAQPESPDWQTQQLAHDLRQFLSGGGAMAALNIPWLPLFFVVLALIHPAFALVAVVVSALMALLHISLARLTTPARSAAQQARGGGARALKALQAQPVLVSMMRIGRNLCDRYLGLMDQAAAQDGRADGTAHAVQALLGFLRPATQISTLALGAALVVNSQLSAGGMIGASILMAKAVAAVEQGLRAWPSISAARRGWAELSAGAAPRPKAETDIPDLSGKLSAETLIYPRGAGAPPRLDRISFELQAGECLAILGESGSGKTTLLHALCGADSAPIGAVRLDETEIRTLPPASRQSLIGYLPQRAEMLEGSIAENICCFAPDRSDAMIVAAARLAGVHGLISHLPQGYDTDLARDGHLLSAGQKQRVALARALYSKPKFLFLDEPNALLDSAGERQLFDALSRLKARGTTIVMVIHRAGVIGLADKVAVMDRGKLADFGPRSAVLARHEDGRRQLRLPISAAAVQDLTDWVQGQFSRASDTELQRKAMIAATELYNFACENGPNSADRHLTFTFKFLDDDSCQLLLSEPGRADTADKIARIRRDVRANPDSFSSMQTDELAMAMVLQLADDFELRSDPKLSAYCVTLRNQAALQPHH